MGLTITKKVKEALKSVPDVTAIDSDIAVKVDAYGSASAELAAKLKELEPLQKLVADLKEELIEEGDSEAADETVTLQGTHYVANLGKKSKQVQSVDKGLLRTMLGDDIYFNIADVKIGDIRKYCSPPQLVKVLKEDLTGKRRLTVSPKE